MQTVKVVYNTKHYTPTYQTSGSSGVDVQADISSPLWIPSFEREVINTGLFFQIPEGYEIQVRPRSGLAAEYGITVLNSPGTIDSDYTGELKVILLNTSAVPYTVQPGDRIAQLILCPVIRMELVSGVIGATERGKGSFGSTGV